MNLVARGRHVLARRPWLYWMFVTALAVTCGLLVARATAEVDEARRAWGATRSVIVAAGDIAPGDPLDGRTVARDVPGPLVPASAITSVPSGAVARQRVAAGETLVRADLAAGGGPRSLVPAGWSAIAVAESVPSGAAVGDPVMAAAGGVVLAGDGVVVGRSGEVVLVAVPAGDAAMVAHAAVTGELSLLLVP